MTEPIEQIRQAIAHHKREAEYARKECESARAQAEGHEERRKEHVEAVTKWREILEREEAAQALASGQVGRNND